MTRAAVLGAGPWGTAFAKILVDAGAEVVLWARRAELAEAIDTRHENAEYLPGVVLPDTLRATADAAEALDGAGVVAVAVPSQSLRHNLSRWVAALPRDATVASLMKGVELGTSLRMSEVLTEVGGVDPARVCVVTGPNLAREIALEQPAATVVACRDHDRAVALQRALQTPYLRPYTNVDIVGCELGGAVKNVIALACGIAGGMGFGDNTRATLITRGLAETTRLGVALGADPATFAGLAGLGDLVATCSSPLSRNRTFGERLARGETLEDLQASARQTAEGVKSCLPVLGLARRHGVDMPITEAVERVCFEGLSPELMMKGLMAREAKAESTHGTRSTVDPAEPADTDPLGEGRQP